MFVAGSHMGPLFLVKQTPHWDSRWAFLGSLGGRRGSESLSLLRETTAYAEIAVGMWSEHCLQQLKGGSQDCSEILGTPWPVDVSLSQMAIFSPCFPLCVSVSKFSIKKKKFLT